MQIFRRSAIRWWTSPVTNPEKTLNISSYGELDKVVQCAPNFPILDANMFALLQKYNRTGCNYQDPLSGDFVECVGTENIRFTACGFGIDEVSTVATTHVGVQVAVLLRHSQLYME
jgi:hypothetical protein